MYPFSIRQEVILSHLKFIDLVNSQMSPRSHKVCHLHHGNYLHNYQIRSEHCRNRCLIGVRIHRLSLLICYLYEPKTNRLPCDRLTLPMLSLLGHAAPLPFVCPSAVTARAQSPSPSLSGHHQSCS